MRDDFAVLILTHGRPDKIDTLKTLASCGYTGKVYLVVDDEDRTLPEYKRLYGDQVIVFSKDEVGKTFDQADLSDDRRAIVWARNVCPAIAQQLGLTHYVQLDDDYFHFSYRTWGKRTSGAEKETYHQWKIYSLDLMFEAMCEFLDSTPATTICFSQGGDHFGGVQGQLASGPRLMRKAMNSFFCRTDRPIRFPGRINEDVNAYCLLGSRGVLFFTYSQLQLGQTQSQQSEGGMSGLYLDCGTYVKSFYTVMMHPSSVQILSIMGITDRRMHHRIIWRATVPKIVRETHRKPRPALNAEPEPVG